MDSISHDEKVLDLACGTVKTEGAVGIDRLALPGVDVVHNLDQFPYPFESNTFDRVVSFNGMEHFDDPLAVLTELHRICKPGAIIHFASPHFSCADYFTDPTHKHPFSSRSFDYLIPGTQHYNLGYAGFPFKKEKVEITFWGKGKIIDRLLHGWVNNHQYFYEWHFAFMLPAHQIIFDLEVVK